MKTPKNIRESADHNGPVFRMRLCLPVIWGACKATVCTSKLSQTPAHHFLALKVPLIRRCGLALSSKKREQNIFSSGFRAFRFSWGAPGKVKRNVLNLLSICFYNVRADLNQNLLFDPGTLLYFAKDGSDRKSAQKTRSGSSWYTSYRVNAWLQLWIIQKTRNVGAVSPR